MFVLSDMCKDLRDVVRAVQGSMKRGDAEKKAKGGRVLESRGMWETRGSLGSRAGLEGIGKEDCGFRLEEWVSEREREGMEGFWAGDGVVGDG